MRFRIFAILQYTKSPADNKMSTSAASAASAAAVASTRTPSGRPDNSESGSPTRTRARLIARVFERRCSQYKRGAKYSGVFKFRDPQLRTCRQHERLQTKICCTRPLAQLRARMLISSSKAAFVCILFFVFLSLVIETTQGAPLSSSKSTANVQFSFIRTPFSKRRSFNKPRRR